MMGCKGHLLGNLGWDLQKAGRTSVDIGTQKILQRPKISYSTLILLSKNLTASLHNLFDKPKELPLHTCIISYESFEHIQ